jgi:hypothetical protein
MKALLRLYCFLELLRLYSSLSLKGAIKALLLLRLYCSTAMKALLRLYCSLGLLRLYASL